MKKLIISGSSKLYERALYWRGYFEGRGYDVIDWPCPITDDPNIEEAPPTPGFLLGRLLNSGDDAYADRMVKTYQRYWRNLDLADVFFLMNEDRDDTPGYIGPSGFSELTAAVIGNLNRGKKVDIYILKVPDKSQACFDEVKFWLDQGWISVYRRPTGKKALLPVSAPEEETSPSEPEPSEEASAEPAPEPAHSHPAEAVVVEAPAKRPGLFSGSSDRTIDLLTCKKKCLRLLSHEHRQYLSIFSSEFPAWLLRYIAAPEFQRLADVSMTSMDYSSLYNFSSFNSVFVHSIGVALIVWKFTRDKKQTLAALFHDIASPSFKHCIDFLNGDSEKQESIEAKTGQIIRDSRVISRALKRDGILASEVSDYHLYPIADNDTPGLAADRLEYTFSNGYYLYETWNLDEIRRFYNNLTVLENESELPELGFRDPELAAEFTERNLVLAANYHSDRARASLQFIADIIGSMITGGYLTMDDLYTMSEREIIDWILSCGDHTLGDAFRNFQRSTSVYSGSTSRRNCWNTSVKAKIRYIVPLAVAPERPSRRSRSRSAEEASSASAPARRITDLRDDTRVAVEEYLAEKQPKYVGFDFDFKPYSS